MRRLRAGSAREGMARCVRACSPFPCLEALEFSSECPLCTTAPVQHLYCTCAVYLLRLASRQTCTKLQPKAPHRTQSLCVTNMASYWIA